MSKTSAILAIVAASAVGTKGLKVAFLGDSEAGSGASGNFQRLFNEDVDIVVHNGDFDYDSDPNLWNNFLNTNWYDKGKNDVLVTSGNHEDDFLSTIFSGGKQWLGNNGYKERLHDKLVAASDLNLGSKCTPREGNSLTEDFGEYYSCETDDVFMVFIGWAQISDSLLGSGGDQDEVNRFLEERLSSTDAKWRICNWHRPEGTVNPGDNHTGDYKTQRAYEICRKYGAFTVHGHSHVYGRTKLITDYDSMEHSNTDVSSSVPLNCGQTFSLTVGMGGKDVGGSGKYANEPWFQSIYTNDIGNREYGAVICDFGASSSSCRFVLDNGSVWDQWTITPPASTAQCQAVASRSPTKVLSSDPVPADAGASGSDGCFRDYARGWALVPDAFTTCGSSCCAAGPAGQPCYYSAPNPASCASEPATRTVSAHIRTTEDDVVEVIPRTEGELGVEQLLVPDSLSLSLTSSNAAGLLETPVAVKGANVGLRFSGMNIPAGATVTSAKLVLTSSSPSSLAASQVQVAVELSANAESFKNGVLPSTRDLSDAVAWPQDSPWTWHVGAISAKESLPLTEAVQQVVNMEGWEAGNAIAVVVQAGFGGPRDFVSFDKDPASSPLLVVTYETAEEAASTGMNSAVVIGAGAGAGVVALAAVGALVWKKKQTSEVAVSARQQEDAFETFRVEDKV